MVVVVVESMVEMVMVPGSVLLIMIVALMTDLGKVLEHVVVTLYILILTK